jgi:predicted amidohydrolase YtcJ
MNAGITVAGSSDAPVEPINPMKGIYAAVVRHKDMGFEECISLEDALKMYTINCHKILGMEKKKGKIEKGYFADIAVFEENLFQIEAERLIGSRVIATIVDGMVKYVRDERLIVLSGDLKQ